MGCELLTIVAPWTPSPSVSPVGTHPPPPSPLSRLAAMGVSEEISQELPSHKPGDETDGSPIRGRSPLRTSPSPSRSHAPSRAASPAPPGLLSDDEDQEEERDVAKSRGRPSQTSTQARARDKENRQLAKSLLMKLSDDNWDEVVKWIDDNTPQEVGSRSTMWQSGSSPALGCLTRSTCTTLHIDGSSSPMHKHNGRSARKHSRPEAHTAYRLLRSAGSGTLHATPVLRYMDAINSTIKGFNRKETAFMDQVWQQFQPSDPPKQLSVDKCGPLERTLFMHQFQTAHIDFWAKEHPHYPSSSSSAPLTFGIQSTQVIFIR